MIPALLFTPPSVSWYQHMDVASEGFQSTATQASMFKHVCSHSSWVVTSGREMPSFMLELIKSVKVPSQSVHK